MAETAEQVMEGETGMDGAGFAGLVREHQSMVFSIAYHFLHDRTAAEELAQDVFLQLYQNLRSVKSAAHVKFWLRKVASHRCIDWARRRARQPQVSLDDLPEFSAKPQAGDPMLAAALQRLVASLPEKPRMMVILRYQEELEPAEIAEVLDIPLGTVKSQLHRALDLLREKLTRSHGDIRI